MKKTKEQRFQEEREYYLKLANSSILFVEKMFGFTPQPPKPEYKLKLEYIVTLEHDEWENGKDLITADWFGDYNEEEHKYDWFDFQKGKHITWQQYLLLLSYDKAIQKKAKSKISVASGHGCHAKGTDIMMSDGTIKKVEDITVGDQLMGDDGTPRNVLQLVRGREQMYRIQYHSGEYYDVNESHILSVIASQTHGTQKRGDITNISVKDYLKWSARKQRTNIGYKARFSFDHKELPIDPYLLGVWLGDGSTDNGIITNPDKEIHDDLLSRFNGKIISGECDQIRINDFTTLLNKNGLLGNKHIPHSYKTASREQRLELLAGLLDTDGYYQNGGYEIIQKKKQLADDIVFLARSLGMNATIHKKKGEIKSINFVGEYYRVSIMRNIWDIPCRVVRKQSKKPLKTQRDELNYGFTVKKLGIDDYYGFTVDHNNLYVLGDFTVTHNCGKSSTVSWLILHFLFGRYGSQVPCTAPTATQMHDVLWKELSIWIAKMPKSFAELYEWNKDYIRMREEPNSWFARAKTSSKENSEALAGVHADWVLTVADEACHDELTEVLTDSGWKLFRDLSKKDKVMTLDRNGFGVYQKPTHYHEYDHEGEMISVDRRGMNFMVTKNHDLYAKTKFHGYKKIKAGEIKMTNLFIPRTIKFKGKEKEVDENIIKLYAWFISEGSFKKNTDGTINAINISQSSVNQKYRDEIKDVIEKLNYKPRIYKKDIVLGNTKLARTLAKECGEGFKNKKIPKWIKDLCPYYLNIFLDTFVKGDGYTRGNRDILYTSSPQLADDLHEIILKTGVNSVVTKRKITGQKKWIKDHFATSSCDNYVITRTKNNSHAKINKKFTKNVFYKGKVYCVTVPNGIVMTRRNGYSMWSGNSGIEEQIFNVAQGAWTSGNIVVILISNPTRNIGFFYDTHHKYKKNWQTLQLSSIGSPIVDPDYEAQIAERHGRDSQEYGIRVLGQFPREDDMDDGGFLPLIADRNIHLIPADNVVFRGNAILGIDPAGEGDDKTVFVIRDQNKAMKIYSEDKSNEKTIAERALSFIEEYQIDPRNVVIDDFGSVGAKVAKEIAIASRGKINVSPINVGDKCDYEAERELYENKRAYMYWKLREWAIAGGSFVEDKALHDELLTIRYKRNVAGRIQIMSKLLMKKKYSYSSPNIADAVALTFLRDIQALNYKERQEIQALEDTQDFDPYSVWG